MIVFLDTSILVDIDRNKEDAIELMRKLTENEVEIYISVATVSEILTGSYLREDSGKALISAKIVLAQFDWIDFDGEVADKSAQIMAYLIQEGKIIEFQDIIIAASFIASDGDYLITNNLDHFQRIPKIKNNVISQKEAIKLFSKKK